MGKETSKINIETQEAERDIYNIVLNIIKQYSGPRIRHFRDLDHELKIRREFPKSEDFEKGIVFTNKNEFNKAINIIRRAGRCLIYGKPASGKTVFALTFGKAFSSSYQVSYLDLKADFVPDRLLEEIITSDNKENLYILDNCHIWPEKVYGFIELTATNNVLSKFLFISRDIQRFLAQSENYFEMFGRSALVIVPTKLVFKNIIKLYERYQCKDITDCKSKDYNVNSIMKKCGKDLFLLSCYLDAWNPKETRRSLDEVKEIEVLDKFSQKYLEPYEKNLWRNRILVSCSALYQFESPIESSFFYPQLMNIPSPNDLDQIFKEGIIEVQERNNERFLFLPHSTFADLILKATEAKSKWLLEGKSAYEYTQEIFLKYLDTKPKDILNITRLLFTNGRKDIAKRYAENDYFSKKLNEYISTINISNIFKWLHFLNELQISEKCREKIFDKKVGREVAKKLQIPGGQRFAWVLKELLKIDESKAQILFEYSKEILKNGLQDEKLTNITLIFEVLAKLKITPSVAKDLLDAVESRNWLQKIEESNLTNLTFLFKHLSKIDSSSALTKYFLKQLTAKQLAHVYKKKDATIKNLAVVYEHSDKEFVIEFGEYFDGDFYNDIYNNSRLSQIGKYHQHYSKYLSILRKAYKVFERDSLNNKLQNSSISDIQKFIFRISKTRSLGVILAKNAIEELRKIEIKKIILRGEYNFDKKVFEPTKLKDVMWLIHNVDQIEHSDFIINQLNDLNLTKELQEAELDTISHFLLRISKSDKDLAKNIINQLENIDIKKIILRSRNKYNDRLLNDIAWLIHSINLINDSQFLINQLKSIELDNELKETSLSTSSFFLWNVFEVDKELAEHYCEIVYESSLIQKIGESKLNEINSFYWNIYQIDQIVPEPFFNNEMRQIVVDKMKQEDVVNSLQTVGIFETSNNSILSEILKIEINEESIVDHIENCVGKSPFALLRLLKGLKAIDEKLLVQIMNQNSDLRMNVLNFLKATADSAITDKTDKLFTEIINTIEQGRGLYALSCQWTSRRSQRKQ
ncbi:MAG: hypothetical protein KKD50_01590 [Proteobacteria bacterium]|nr:hypothetical protein [Pseudomonadota bacterium]